MNQDRRNFIKTSVASAAALSLANTGLAQTKRKIKKTLKFGMINDPKAKSIQEKLQVAKNAGFDAVEPNTIFNANEVKEFIAGSKAVGIHLDAIICSTHWSSPLSDPDPKVVDKTMEGMEVSMNNAKAIGADVVLLVPAVVNPKVMYKDAYTRSQERVKELATIAEKLQITIGLENVWNKFLLSPIEFRRYIEEINSPYVKAFFDIGNFNFWSYPQDWIRTLDELIVRMDVKDFDNGSFKFVELLKGTVPWAEAMKACDDIGYEGYLAAEVQGGDQQYLTEAVSKAMDTIIAM